MASIANKTLVFKLDTEVYSKESMLKCLYWHLPDFTIDIKLIKDTYIIKLKNFII